jgi:hypothetical protein
VYGEEEGKESKNERQKKKAEDSSRQWLSLAVGARRSQQDGSS